MFNKMSFWPVGYFRAYTSWILRHRRTIAARVGVLNADLVKIGLIKVFYGSVVTPGGGTEATSERLGFAVTPGSSLEKLVRAYIAQGGNPLDISSFMLPDTTEFLADGSKIQLYPGGGFASPQSVEANSPVGEDGDSGYGASRGGHAKLDSYAPGRMGGRIDRGAVDDATIVSTMHQIRAWANQDIKEMQRLGNRIIKQMDLREQLLTERDAILVEAFGDAVSALDGEFDPDLHVNALRVQNLITDMNRLLFETYPDGTVVAYRMHPEAGLLGFTYPDKPSDARDPLNP